MELNRKTIDKVRSYAEELGYKILWEKEHRFDDELTVNLLIQGYAEEFGVDFKLNAETGYLCWDRSWYVRDYSSDPIPSWGGPRGLQQALKAVRELGLAEGLRPYDKPSEEEED